MLKKQFFLFLSLFTLSFAYEQNISYEIAKNYFSKVRVDKITVLKITNEKEFEENFGAAATMGRDGKPTQIDFETSFVVAIISPITDKNLSFEIDSLKQNSDNLYLSYKVKNEGELSFQIQPCKIVIIDKKYDKNLKTKEIVD